MSRQNFSPNPSEQSPPPADSTLERQSDSPAVSSSSPHHAVPPRGSESSEGYPSWLPKRPPPPAPASTFQSSVGMFHEPTEEPIIVGRKPTPRSIRIVSVADSKGERDAGRREPTDQTRVGQPVHSRVWSRATTAGRSPTALSAYFNQPHVPSPRFKSNGLHLELLRNPSLFSRLHYYLLPIFTFYHIPLQTFFDFNAVYILIQVAKYPNPVAPGVPGSGRNWVLGATAYVACWFTWFFVVFIVYELVYSFYRRWRVKRPLILPIYMSSTAFNLASMTSYDTHTFLQYLRFAAFHPEQGGNLRDGLSETCWYYSQNTATIALLLPRAGLSLALLLTFASSQPSVLALVNTGTILRDKTFFRPQDGALTAYARGVLIANAAWTAWRTLIFLISWVGLWILSGHGCAGVCGPRFRWDEEDAEKTASFPNDDGELDPDALPWAWKQSTRIRIQEAFEFCLTTRHPSQGSKRELSEIKRSPEAPHLAGMEQILAAIGFPGGPQPARRGVLSDQLFESPGSDTGVDPEISEKVKGKAVPNFSSIIPPLRGENRDPGPSGPLMNLPYPFTGHRAAQVSSDEQVPFPPSPRHSKSKEDDEDEDADKENMDVETEMHDDVEEADEEDEGGEEDEEEPSSDRRTSGSLSSLGQPVPSRYPFQYRRPRGGSMSSRSHMTPQSHSTNTKSTPSRSTQSTGNVESSDSPWSNGSSGAPSPRFQPSSGIPMPPRHPQAYHRRSRAGTVPVGPGSPTPVFSTRPRPRVRTESGSTSDSRIDPTPLYESSDEGEELPMEQPEAEGPHEEAEREDSLGLLSAAPSPRTSLIGLKHRPSNLSRRRNGSSSGSNSRSPSQGRSQVGSIHSGSRSRTQSLIQTLGVGSRSSLDLVRSRAHSLVRLSDSPYHSNSDAIPSSPDDNTFGHPLRVGRLPPSDLTLAEQQSVRASSSDSAHGSIAPQSRIVPSMELNMMPFEMGSDGLPTVMEPPRQTQAVPIPGQGLGATTSQRDVSTAAQSFVTAPATIQGSTTTESDDAPGRTPSGWSNIQQHLAFDNSMRPV